MKKLYIPEGFTIKKEDIKPRGNGKIPALDKNFFKQLKKQIRKDFGKRCDSYSSFCVVCVVWHGFDNLEEAYLDKEHFDKLKEKK